MKSGKNSFRVLLRSVSRYVDTFFSRPHRDPSGSVNGSSEIAITTPDLFDEPDAEVLYQTLIARLDPEKRPELVNEVCRQIHVHAATRNLAIPAFTYAWRIQTLVALQKYEQALSVTQECERTILGEASDLPPSSIDYRTMELMRSKYAPLLFFLERYEAARSIFDQCNSLSMRSCTNSLHLLDAVFSPIVQPEILPSVAQNHVYAKLGLELDAWDDWESFVAGFSPSRLRRAKISRDELLANPGLLAEIQATQQASLHSRSEARQPRIDAATAHLRARIDRVNDRLEAICDFLADIPRIL